MKTIQMRTVEQRQWRRSGGVFFVNCEHISQFVLIVDFEQASVYWVHIVKATIFEGKIRYIMLCCNIFGVNKIY